MLQQFSCHMCFMVIFFCSVEQRQLQYWVTLETERRGYSNIPERSWGGKGRGKGGRRKDEEEKEEE